jgi:hypothetical protein
MTARATGVVAADNDLVRKNWMVEGLIQNSSMSYWSKYTGKSFKSIVYQETDISAGKGHTVTFDFSGNLSGKAIKDKETAYGKGEQKKKFSESITVSRYRLVVDNGDKFDGVNIGDLSINEHTQSRQGLADLFVRWKDQALFDTAQGFYGDSANPHRILYDASSTNISHATLVEIETTLRTGRKYDATTAPLGYSVGTTPSTAVSASTSVRGPLPPFRLKNGKSCWLMMIDPLTAANLKTNATVNSGIVAMALQADLRGDNNMMFDGIIGSVGQLVLVEAEQFFGQSDGTTGLNATNVEIAGLRTYDDSQTAWLGESSFAASEYSRNLILGESALILAFGKMPDYKFQKSQDFGIKSESAVEFWMNCQKTMLDAASTDYNMAKVAAIDYGVVCFDVKH